jgi:hypothetical protein
VTLKAGDGGASIGARLRARISPLHLNEQIAPAMARGSRQVESRMGAVAWAIRQRSVSHPRSSNRTCEASKLIQRHVRERKMQTKTLQQTVTFRASPKEVYDMLTDSKKHQSLSGMPAKISKRVGGKFTAWGSH